MCPFRRKAEIDLPSFSAMPVPDPKWTRRHLRDVRAMLEMADLTKDKSVHVDAAAILTEAFMSTLPAGLEQVTSPTEIESSIEASARLGLAFAGLYAKDRTTPPEIHDALQWASFIAIPTDPTNVVAAVIFACHAGHYYGHVGEQTLPLLVNQLDWREALSVSPRAAVFIDAMQAAWSKISGQPQAQ